MTKRTDFKKLLLSPNSTISEAGSVIQSQGVKFALVCDEAGKLLGTLTDGDIRRSVIGSVSPNSPVCDIMNTSPLIISRNKSIREIRETMVNNLIHHLPEVDERGAITNLFVLDELDEMVSLPNAFVLMAGGKGMRLRPLTEKCPKPLIDIAGKPVLERIIETLIGQGFHRFFISINYLGHMIENYFGDGSKWGVEISYLREDKPLGTAGALASLPKLNEPVCVMNGDIITKANFQTMLEMIDKGAKCVMGVREYKYTVPYGCLVVDGPKVLGIQEKPTMGHLINAGSYVLSPDVVESIRKNEYLDMPDLLSRVIKEGEVVHQSLISEQWIDIGSHSDLEWAKHLYGA